MIHRLTRRVLPAALAGAALMAAPLTVQGQQQQQQQQQQQRAQQQATGEPAPVHLSPSSVRLIQIKLNSVGYDPGTVDGQWGQQTSRAVRSFQQTQGLEPTGNLNVETVQAMDLGSLLEGKIPEGRANQQLAQEHATGIGAPLYASPKTIKSVKQALSNEGIQVESPEQGTWNSQTEQALKQYHQQNGASADGMLTLKTLDDLGLSGEFESMTNGDRQTDMSDSETAQRDRQDMSRQNQQDRQDQQDQRNQQDQQMARQGQSSGQSAEGAKLHISSQGVRQIEQALKDKGHDVGQVDGNWDNSATTAMKSFQEANGLEPTGNLNLRSLRALGFDQPLTGLDMGDQQGQRSNR